MSNSSDVNSSTRIQIPIAVRDLARYSTIPGAIVCFLVLVACSFAVYFPRSRQYMNRVSFRLLIYSLISYVLFGIAYAAAPSSPGTSCDLAAFITNVFGCLSSFLTTCIAINLQLVVVHHINGQRMEKYYFIGSMLLSLSLNVPALALNQFGYNDSSSICWYKDPDATIRLHWMIATQSCPLALSATIETVCSCILLVYMYLVQRNREALFVSVILSSIRSITRAVTDSNYDAEGQRLGRSRNNLAQHPRYRKAILRIVLYPIVSLVVNFLTVALDLNSTIQGVTNQITLRLHIVDITLVGLRTLPYGVLAAFDPALNSAVRELLGKDKPRTEPTAFAVPVNPHWQLPGTTTPAQSRSNMVESTSSGERILNAFASGENGNGDDPDGEWRIGVENMGQDLEIIERQI